MQFILIFTEGANTEPEYIKAFDIAIRGIDATLGQEIYRPEIIPLTLDGNQGHMKIVEKSKEKFEEWKYKEDSTYEYFEEDEDSIKKFIVCDYDRMHKNGIRIDELRHMADSEGYTLILTKPAFEYFLLLHFITEEDAIKIKPGEMESEINNQIKLLNENLPFPIGGYSKHEHSTLNCFSDLFTNRPVVIGRIISVGDGDGDGYEYFTEMPVLLKYIKDSYKSVQ
jgi:hypothetical protein